MTEAPPLQQLDRTFVRFNGRKLSYFSGCDYFRLASHPKVISALQTGLKKYGLNVASSRLTTGNHSLYGELERKLAAFFHAEDAALVSTGYISNLVAAQALAGNFSHALVDERSHPSLSEAARFLDCPVVQFKHRDPNALKEAVVRCGPHSKLILLTDGMFSHDGSAAPLAEYLKILPKDAMILVDDAHGAGVLGETGQGAIEHAGVSRRRIIQTITLSKSFGVYGGAIVATLKLRKNIFSRSRMFIGSTPLPLPLASAALQSVALLKSDKSFRRRLIANRDYVKTALNQRGFKSETPGPIVPIIPKNSTEASRLKRALLKAGIYPPFTKYPGAPATGYFRFVISSEHTRAQLDRLIRVLQTELSSNNRTS
jgi:7-keto-8-aminopelargonate synthetase-like enzyme